jgi:hypothetical protein
MTGCSNVVLPSTDFRPLPSAHSLFVTQPDSQAQDLLTPVTLRRCSVEELFCPTLAWCCLWLADHTNDLVNIETGCASEAFRECALPAFVQASSNYGQAEREGNAAEQRHEAEKHLIVLCYQT